MTYDPLLPTSRDQARLRLGDTSNSSATERFANATYDALIVTLGDWRLAAASLARSLAAIAAPKPTSFTAVGDLSLGWSDPASAWLKIAAALEAEAAAAQSAIGGRFTLGMPFLTGGDYVDGGAEW